MGKQTMGLHLTFWPNPVYRNHPGEGRWYFHVSVHQEGAKSVHVWRYRGEWYDLTDHLHETKEDRLDLHLAPNQHISYPDLWVSSSVCPFRYRLIIFGREEDAQEVRAEATLICQ
jgi:hypothetical protein